MKAHLRHTVTPEHVVSLTLSGSKSESNRALILKALFEEIHIENLSECDDTLVLQNALEKQNGLIDIGHAGTAMRFLTAYFAFLKGSQVTLTGSSRMLQRPVAPLVDALRQLGAHISYGADEGYPPLLITGTEPTGKTVHIDPSLSSQFVTALMLVAPSFSEGLEIRLSKSTVSQPYIEMTGALLRQIGISCTIQNNQISISPKYPEDRIYEVLKLESDWSSASYFYALVAISRKLSISLDTFFRTSIQGDSALIHLFEPLGVSTRFDDSKDTIWLEPNGQHLPEQLKYDLVDHPDLAQTLAVTCYALGIPVVLSGLQTLRIKETDRVLALEQELKKLGAAVRIENDTISICPGTGIPKEVEIATYQDHRMAMAFACLSQKIPITINDPEVVSKSFPAFWDALKETGISVQFQR